MSANKPLSSQNINCEKELLGENSLYTESVIYAHTAYISTLSTPEMIWDRNVPVVRTLFEAIPGIVPGSRSEHEFLGSTSTIAGILNIYEKTVGNIRVRTTVMGIRPPTGTLPERVLLGLLRLAQEQRTHRPIFTPTELLRAIGVKDTRRAGRIFSKVIEILNYLASSTFTVEDIKRGKSLGVFRGLLKDFFVLSPPTKAGKGITYCAELDPVRLSKQVSLFAPPKEGQKILQFPEYVRVPYQYIEDNRLKPLERAFISFCLKYSGFKKIHPHKVRTIFHAMGVDNTKIKKWGPGRVEKTFLGCLKTAQTKLYLENFTIPNNDIEFVERLVKLKLSPTARSQKKTNTWSANEGLNKEEQELLERIVRWVQYPQFNTRKSEKELERYWKKRIQELGLKAVRHAFGAENQTGSPHPAGFLKRIDKISK